MRLFLDTGEHRRDPRDQPLGRADRGHHEPLLVAKEHEDPEHVWKQILEEVDGDVSLEVTETDADAMYEQGVGLAQKGANAVVKVPMTPAGLEAGTRLIDDGIRINVTLVFSPAQAILAAEIGAYIVSPFIGRIDDAARRRHARAADRSARSTRCRATRPTSSAASLRHPMHVVDAALAGADIATMPYDVFTKLVKHPLTDIGLDRFQADWNTLQQDLKGGA